MKKAIALWGLLTLLPGLSTAAVVIDTGGFPNGLTSAIYSSSDTPTPFFFTLGGMVIGIDKFDPALGILIDMIIDVSPAEPITGVMAGDLSATQIDEMKSFDVFADASAEFGVFYEHPGNSLIPTSLTTTLSIFPGCGGGVGEGGCGDFGDDTIDLFGMASIIGIVDPADFIGAGLVDSLFVHMFYPETAGWVTDNADGEMTIDYDLFGMALGNVIAVNYVYTPIPVPLALWLLVAPLAILRGLRQHEADTSKKNRGGVVRATPDQNVPALTRGGRESTYRVSAGR